MFLKYHTINNKNTSFLLTMQCEELVSALGIDACVTNHQILTPQTYGYIFDSVSTQSILLIEHI